MREIKLGAVEREVKKAWKGWSCDGHSCVMCIEMIRGKYERWFALLDDGYDCYLGIVSAEDLSADIVCPSELDSLETWDGDDENLPSVESDKIIEMVKLV